MAPMEALAKNTSIANTRKRRNATELQTKKTTMSLSLAMTLMPIIGSKNLLLKIIIIVIVCHKKRFFEEEETKSKVQTK